MREIGREIRELEIQREREQREDQSYLKYNEIETKTTNDDEIDNNDEIETIQGRRRDHEDDNQPLRGREDDDGEITGGQGSSSWQI